MNNILQRIIPEQAGVYSEGISNFIACIRKNTINLHGFMLLRYGKVAAEGYYKPFGRNEKHRIYSISKSITSTAVGLAIDEGRLSLDDRIIDIFPQYVKGSVHKYSENMTVRHLLIMSTVHQVPTSEYSEDWIAEFINTKPDRYPGTVFAYDTTGTNILCAIVQQVTGITVHQYLKSRVFDKIGMKEIEWDMRPGSINNGGSGISCTLEDIARFGQLYLQKGVWNGEQIVPKQWIDISTAKHIDTSNFSFLLEGRNGYGFQFWRSRNNSFMSFGAGGQFILVLPEKNIVFVTLGNTMQRGDEHQLILEAFWEHIYPRVAEVSTAGESYTKLQEELNNLSFSLPQGKNKSHWCPELHDRSLKLDMNDYGYASCQFIFNRDESKLRFVTVENEMLEVNFGIENWITGREPFGNKKCVSAAVWVDNNTLMISIQTLDYTQSYLLTCTFNQRYFTIQVMPAGELDKHRGFLNGDCAAKSFMI